MSLRDKVTATVDRAVREDEAHVSITLKNGRTLEKHVEHAVGSLDRPMSDGDLETKFRGLCGGILSRLETENLIRLCWDVAKLKDVGEVARASVPALPAVRRKVS